MDGDWLENFKQQYSKGRYDLPAQVPYLASLAAEYLDRYSQSRKWTDCLKVRKTEIKSEIPSVKRLI